MSRLDPLTHHQGEDDVSWDTWVRTHPPPVLEHLLDRYGSWSRIPEHAWEEWDAACQAWEASRRDRLFGSRTWQMAEPKNRPKKR